MAKQQELKGVGRIRPVLIGLAAGLAVVALMLFLFSVLITMRDVPQGIIDPLAVFALMSGALVSGVVCTRITRSGGLLYGALCGAALSALVLLGGFFSGVDGIGLSGVFRVALAVLSAVIGGVVGANMRDKPEYR